MLLIARVVFFAFAALLIIGGVAGYVEKGSLMSLIAGGVCGVLSLVAGIILPTQPSVACYLAIAAAVLVVGSQAPRVAKNPKIFPGITLIVSGILTIGVSAAALVALRSPAVGQTVNTTAEELRSK